MAFEIQGKLVAVYNTVQRSESFKTREFVIETSEEGNGRTFISYVKFQCTQDRTSMCDKLNIGDNIKVHFNLRGSKWSKDGRDNYITNLDAWRIENLQGMNSSYNDTKPSSLSSKPSSSDEDDLPF